jgi:hypothetical protein
MAEVRYPSTKKTQETPAAPPNLTGVLLASPGSIGYGGRMILHGVYVLPEEEAARIDEQLHRALVAVVTIGGSAAAWNPFREVVLFPDDEERSGRMRRGYFHFDAYPDRAELHHGEYYAMVSLGRFLSNSIRIRVR